MYQFLVLGLGFLFLFTAGYFLKQSHFQEIIISKQQSYATSTSEDSVPGARTPSLLSGEYKCDSFSKCSDEKTLTLYQNGELKVVTSYENGAEVVEEQGSWLFEEGGRIIFTITGTLSQLYETPHILHVATTSSSTLFVVRDETASSSLRAGFSFRKKE